MADLQLWQVEANHRRVRLDAGVPFLERVLVLRRSFFDFKLHLVRVSIDRLLAVAEPDGACSHVLVVATPIELDRELIFALHDAELAPFSVDLQLLPLLVEGLLSCDVDFRL